MIRKLALTVVCLAIVAGYVLTRIGQSVLQADEGNTTRRPRTTQGVDTKSDLDEAVAAKKQSQLLQHRAAAQRLQLLEKSLVAQLTRLVQLQEKTKDDTATARIEDEIAVVKRKLDELKTAAAKLARVLDSQKEHGNHAHNHEHAGGDLHQAENHEQDGFAEHIRQLQLHKAEIEIRAAEMEVRAAEFEIAGRFMRAATDKHHASAWAIRKAAQTLPLEEAIEWLEEMESQTRDQAVVSMIRMKLAELHEQTDHQQLKDSLQKLVIGK